MNLTTWQYALYAQLEDRPHSVRQLMSTYALPQDQVKRMLRDLQALGLVENDGGVWALRENAVAPLAN